MAINYARIFNRRSTPQSQSIPGSTQVPNPAGGYSWQVDDWTSARSQHRHASVPLREVCQCSARLGSWLARCRGFRSHFAKADLDSNLLFHGLSEFSRKGCDCL